MGFDNGSRPFSNVRNYPPSVFVPCPVDLLQLVRVDPRFEGVFVLLLMVSVYSGDGAYE